MATIHITRQQYRSLSDATKSAAGVALNLSTFARMGNCWGIYSPWALLVCKDATDPESEWCEISQITLARSVNTAKLHSAGPGRPELDWSKLEDHEIFPFIVWHEIGHRMDNFDALAVMALPDISVRNECFRRMKLVNEVLADRYAWEHIRPGEPIPISAYGQTVREKLLGSLEYLNTHAPRTARKPRFLELGQYKNVPDDMLATKSRASFIGPDVSRSLLQQNIKRHSIFVEKNGRTMW